MFKETQAVSGQSFGKLAALHSKNGLFMDCCSVSNNTHQILYYIICVELAYVMLSYVVLCHVHLCCVITQYSILEWGRV